VGSSPTPVTTYFVVFYVGARPGTVGAYDSLFDVEWSFAAELCVNHLQLNSKRLPYARIVLP
jgi:hypothetical protein